MVWAKGRSKCFDGNAFDAQITVYVDTTTTTPAAWCRRKTAAPDWYLVDQRRRQEGKSLSSKQSRARRRRAKQAGARVPATASGEIVGEVEREGTTRGLAVRRFAVAAAVAISAGVLAFKAAGGGFEHLPPFL